jgi:hypothetical protein
LAHFSPHRMHKPWARRCARSVASLSSQLGFVSLVSRLPKMPGYCRTLGLPWFLLKSWPGFL